MSIKAVIVIIIVVVVSAFIATKFCNKRDKGNTKKSFFEMILLQFVIPIIAGLISGYIANIIFPLEVNLWENNITTMDEKVLEENGCSPINDYYVRILETDRKLSEGNVSTYLRRIETSDSVKSEDHNYRYIEVINKSNGTSPQTVVYQKDNEKKDYLCLENVHGEYSGEEVFYSKEGTIAKYYLYNDIEIKDNEVDFDKLYGADNGNTYINYFSKEQYQGDEEEFILNLYSIMELNTGEIGDGFRRTYIGKVNDYVTDKGVLYHYIQSKEISDGQIPEIIPIIDENNFPDEFNHIEGTHQRKIIALTPQESTSNIRYAFAGMNYMGTKEGESEQTLYKYTECRREE